VEQINVAVIGVGLQGGGHLASYKALEGVNLVAVCDVNEEAARAAAEAIGAAKCYTDYREMLASERLDGVSIVIPDHLHYQPTMAALDAGAHVLLEKPMALSVPEAEEMAAKANAAGLNLMVNFSHRHQLPSILAKQRIDSGEVGQPIYAYARLNNTLFVPTKMLSWAQKTALPHWLITHEMDRIRWFFGSEARKVYAVSYSGVLKSRGYDVADLYQATVTFDNGAIGNVESAWIIPETAPWVADCRTHFICTDGWLDIDHMEPVVKVATHQKYSHPGIMGGVIRGEPVGTVFEAVKHFVRCVQRGEKTDVTPEDGVAITKIACAIVESAATGEPVAL
jgi:predicted dehydrogenase